jgi:hypothetical protein
MIEDRRSTGGRFQYCGVVAVLKRRPASREEAKLKRCAQCHGKFGLIRHRWYAYQFCTKTCREGFLRKLTEEKELVHGWLAYLKPSDRTRAPKREI